MALVVDSRRRWGEGLVAWPPFAGSTRTLPSFSRIMCQKARRCQGTNRDVKIFTLSMFWCLFQAHFDECVILFLKAFIYCFLFYVCVWVFFMDHWLTLECIQHVFVCMCWRIGHIIMLCMNVQTCLDICGFRCFYLQIWHIKHLNHLRIMVESGH
jgi:hypothetical protein